MAELWESDRTMGKMRNDDMSETWKNEQIQKNMRKRLRICIFLNAMQKNNNFNTVQYVQKKYEKFVRFVHTYSVSHDIIITVKTPQYIIQFLLYPIVKIPSPKKTAIVAVFFTLCFYKQQALKHNILKANVMNLTLRKISSRKYEKIGLPSKTCYGIILSCQDNFIF